MRDLRGDNKLLRFGWVIVDDTKRGKKYGQKMLTLGLEYAFEIMRVDKVTIGVIEKTRVHISAIGQSASANLRIWRIPLRCFMGSSIKSLSLKSRKRNILHGHERKSGRKRHEADSVR